MELRVIAPVLLIRPGSSGNGRRPGSDGRGGEPHGPLPFDFAHPAVRAPAAAPHPAMYNEGMDRHGPAREEMEKAYGEVGSGAATLVVRGVTCRLREILSR